MKNNTMHKQMAEFIWKTNSSSVNTFDGPSGLRYVIYLNKPFTVNIQQDINFFRNNQRFDEVSIIDKILPPEPEPTKEDVFKEEVNKLKVKKETKEEILKAYLNREDFINDLEEDYQISPKTTKKELKIIKSHFLVDGDTKKPEKFDSVETIKKNIKKKR